MVVQGKGPAVQNAATLAELNADAGDVIAPGETRFIDGRLWYNPTNADITVPVDVSSAGLSGAGLVQTGNAANNKMTKINNPKLNHIPVYDNSGDGEVKRSDAKVESARFIGDALTLEAKDIITHHNLAEYYEADDAEGALVIWLPDKACNRDTRLNLRVVGFNGKGGNSWVLEAHGYDSADDLEWADVCVTLEGNAPFHDVRFAHGAANERKCIVLGDPTGTEWFATHVKLETLMVGYKGKNEDWHKGWEIRVVTDPSEIDTNPGSPLASPQFRNTDWAPLELTNGWKIYGGVYQIPEFRIVKGVVHLRGLIDSGETSAVMCQLPPWAYPPKRELMHSISAGGQARIDILPNGDLLGVTVDDHWTSVHLSYAL